MSNADLFIKINALPADLKKELSDFIDKLLKRVAKGASQKEPTKKKRQLGLMKGQIRMSDDFDAPLDDFKEYM